MVKFSKKLSLKIALIFGLFSLFTTNVKTETYSCYKKHFECIGGKSNSDLEIILRKITDSVELIIGAPSEKASGKKVYLGQIPSATNESTFYAQTNFKPDDYHHDKFVTLGDFSEIPLNLRIITDEAELDNKNIGDYILN